MSDPTRKWSRADAGRRYAAVRFRTLHAAERDPRLVEAWLCELDLARGAALDVPCGAGRLSAAIASTGLAVVGVDLSRPMLEAARAAGQVRLVQADARELPFPDRCFELVVACRLLHHLHEEGQRERLLTELARVSRRYVLASFWDSASLPGWRRALGLKRDEGPRGRVALSRASVAALCQRSGLVIQAWRSTLRFVSQQSFFLAQVRAP